MIVCYSRLLVVHDAGDHCRHPDPHTAGGIVQSCCRCDGVPCKKASGAGR